MAQTQDICAFQKAVALHIKKEMEENRPGIVRAAFSEIGFHPDGFRNAEQGKTYAFSSVRLQIQQGITRLKKAQTFT